MICHHQLSFLISFSTIHAYHLILKNITLTGITMTEKSLQKSFSQHGVIKYGAVGDVFDPALHDALFALPDPTKTSGLFSNLFFSDV